MKRHEWHLEFIFHKEILNLIAPFYFNVNILIVENWNKIPVKKTLLFLNSAEQIEQ